MYNSVVGPGSVFKLALRTLPPLQENQLKIFFCLYGIFTLKIFHPRLFFLGDENYQLQPDGKNA